MASIGLSPPIISSFHGNAAAMAQFSEFIRSHSPLHFHRFAQVNEDIGKHFRWNSTCFSIVNLIFRVRITHCGTAFVHMQRNLETRVPFRTMRWTGRRPEMFRVIFRCGMFSLAWHFDILFIPLSNVALSHRFICHGSQWWQSVCITATNINCLDNPRIHTQFYFCSGRNEKAVECRSTYHIQLKSLSSSFVLSLTLSRTSFGGQSDLQRFTSLSNLASLYICQSKRKLHSSHV